MLTVDSIQRTFRAMLNSYTSFGLDAKDAQRDIGLKIALAMSSPGKDTDSMFKDVRGDYLRDVNTYLDGVSDDTHDRIADFAEAVRDANYFGKGVDEAAREFLKIIVPITTSLPIITPDMVTSTTQVEDSAVGGNTTVMPKVLLSLVEDIEVVEDVHPALRPILDGMTHEYTEAHAPDRLKEMFELTVDGSLARSPESAYQQIRGRFLLDMDTLRRNSPFVSVVRKNPYLGITAAAA